MNKNIFRRPKHISYVQHPQLLFEDILSTVVIARQMSEFVFTIPPQIVRLPHQEIFSLAWLHQAKWYEEFFIHTQCRDFFIIGQGKQKNWSYYADSDGIRCPFGIVDISAHKKNIASSKLFKSWDEQFFSDQLRLHHQIPRIRALSKNNMNFLPISVWSQWLTKKQYTFILNKILSEDRWIIIAHQPPHRIVDYTRSTSEQTPFTKQLNMLCMDYCEANNTVMSVNNYDLETNNAKPILSLIG
jgi:predicted class III extradiol MEMO1 family dioxygenase